MCLLLRNGFRLATLPYRPVWCVWVLQRWLSFSKIVPSPQRNSGAMSEWPSCSWSPRPKPFSSNCSVWLDDQLWRVLVVPNFFHLRMMEATVFLDLQCCRHLLVPFPRSVPRHNPVSELYGQFLRPHGLVFALTFTVNCGTIYRQMCAFPNICPIDWIYHRWTPIKL